MAKFLIVIIFMRSLHGGPYFVTSVLGAYFCELMDVIKYIERFVSRGVGLWRSNLNRHNLVSLPNKVMNCPELKMIFSVAE